jgi:hypothetical protein
MNLRVTSKFVNFLDNCWFLMDNVTLNSCVNKFYHLEEADEVLMLGRNTMLVLRLLRRKVSVIRFWLHFPAQLFPHSLLHIECGLDADRYVEMWIFSSSSQA